MSEISKENDELYKQAQFEEDIPLDNQYCNNEPRIDIIEERLKQEFKDREHNRNLIDLLTKWGFRLIVFCLVIVLILHVFDAVILSMGLQVSGLSESIFELCKSIITMLLGFLFAKNIEYKK